jgi:hypothetical protein
MAKQKWINSNKFNEAGELEREFIIKIAKILNVEYTLTNSSCAYDAVFVKDGITSMVESKVRYFHSGTFESAMIEKEKYDNLLKLQKQNGATKVLYIFFFNDNKALIFNLNNITPVWEEKELNKNTVVKTGTRIKTIYNIPNNKGIVINL